MTVSNKRLAVADMCDRLATIDMSRTEGAVLLSGGEGGSVSV